VRPLTTPPDGDQPQAREAAVRVELDTPLPLVVGDPVILRDAGRQVVATGGVVADPDPGPVPRRRAARERRSAALVEVAAGDREERMARLLALRGGVAVRDRLSAAAGIDDAPGLHRLGEYLLDDDGLDRATSAVTGLGAGTHDRDRVARALEAAGLPGALARPLVDALLAKGTLVRTSGGVVLAEHAEAAADARSARATALLAELDAAPFAPPDLDALAREVGLDHRELVALVQAGEIVRAGKVAFSRRAVERAAEVLHEHFGDGRAFTAAEAKQAWQTTRRFAIPLLEHLDRTGVTRFDGQHRWLRDR
ncbi:MAG: SelB C-terminal domain-containing protein, partial [Actinomycetota bacterium]